MCFRFLRENWQVLGSDVHLCSIYLHARMYVGVCVCVLVCIYTYTCIHVYMCVCISVYIYLYISIYIYIYTHTYMPACLHASWHSCVHSCTRTHACAHTHVVIRVYARTHGPGLPRSHHEHADARSCTPADLWRRVRSSRHFSSSALGSARPLLSCALGGRGAHAGAGAGGED